MARLAAAADLDSAAQDLKQAADRLADVCRHLADEVAAMRWKGAGATRFQGRVHDRRVELRGIVEGFDTTVRALRQAADSVRAESRDIAELEHAYRDLVSAGAIPHQHPAPPPPGDTRWREYLPQVMSSTAR